MIAAVKHHWPAALALLLGFSVAVVFAPIVLATASWYAQWDAENNPPATLQWHGIERVDANALRMQVVVTRHRDCQIVRVLGYTGATLATMRPAESMEREDGRVPQSYPVGIAVISRPWILRGVYGNKLAVAAYYDCDDAVVKAPLLIGDVPALP